MSDSLFPAALKPILVGFAIGFVLVGISRVADGRAAAPDKVVHLSAPSPKVSRDHHIALR